MLASGVGLKFSTRALVLVSRLLAAASARSLNHLALVLVKYGQRNSLQDMVSTTHGGIWLALLKDDMVVGMLYWNTITMAQHEEHHFSD